MTRTRTRVPNNLQNFPEITLVTTGSTTIDGILESAAGTEYQLQFFSSAECDGSGFGEGEELLGAITEITNANGRAHFTATFTQTVPNDRFITATATAPDGSTSEFSRCWQVGDGAVPLADLSVVKVADPDPAAVGAELTYTVTVSNLGPAVATAVIMTDELGPGLDFLSADEGCAELDKTVTCDLGSLNPDGSRTVAIRVLPRIAGPAENMAHAASREGDPLPENNIAVITTNVQPSQVFKCAGIAATLLGTDGNDVLMGTNGDDVIVGLGGGDVIRGLGGDDVVCAGPGDDTVIAGGGQDRIYGQAGNDSLRGGVGNDRLFGGAGRDVLKGQGGNDRLLGQKGHDRLTGSGGKDVLKGGGGNDKMYGGRGADTLLGGGGDDTMDCGPGSDSAEGGPGDDTTEGCETIE